jgi:probable phosphoglycerate mutase
VTATPVPAGVRTVPAVVPADATRLVLVRHGEAVCNVAGVVGGPLGCTGLSALGATQVAALADRLHRTGELAGTDALYASVLPRARQTAEILRPALNAGRHGPPLVVTERCDLCELHPGEGDGLGWGEFVTRFGEPRWDVDPTTPLSPGGESWTSFVVRAGDAVEAVAGAHRGQLVVVACHAGVVEAAMLRLLPLDPAAAWRGWLHTAHASMTEFVLPPGDGARWMLRRYNDMTPVPEVGDPPPRAQQA